MNNYDFRFFGCIVLAGMFNACMDIRHDYFSVTWLYDFFWSLGLSSWYEGGTEKYRFIVLVWDFWHVAKNMMLLSFAFGAYQVAYGSFPKRFYVVLIPLIFGVSFMVFYHLVFGATYAG